MSDNRTETLYIRRKRRRKVAAIISTICASLLTILIVIALNIFYVDGFTISVSKESQLFLTVDETREIITTELNIPQGIKATDAQYSDIPDNIDDELGSKITNNYFAYTFYLGSNSTVNYSLSMTLNRVSNDLDDAMRVMIIRNSERTVYAKANDDGTPKLIYHGENHNNPDEILGTTKSFKDNKHIILEPYSINKDGYDKYTIVMWIDGWESNNLMKGGVFHSDVKFSTISNNN